MPTRALETDYLVVGCGAAGMAFADALVTHSNADLVLVDRRHAPGGHWNQAYSFVRLHQPSAFYGVNSLPLGNDTLDVSGLNAGFYERASAPEICAYYDRVMRQQLLPSGRVRYFPMTEHRGDGELVSLLSGERFQVRVKKALVDATYLEPAIPASTPAPFEVGAGAHVIPVSDLARTSEAMDRYVVIGAGKTAMDACTWLLESEVSPDAISWIKPREAWLNNRAYVQCRELAPMVLEGVARQMEAASAASSLDNLFERLEAKELLLRVDQSVRPTMYKAPTISVREVELLRRIQHVVRLGHVQRIERDEIVLDRGTVPTDERTLHVHCAAAGLNPAPAVPIFATQRITLQPVRTGLIPFNAALVGYVEATRSDVNEKNRLCPTNRLPDTPLDWVRGTLIGMNADYILSKEPDIADWLERSRLNLASGLGRLREDPRVKDATQRLRANARSGLVKLMQFLAES
jgi:hypothetical protein